MVIVLFILLTTMAYLTWAERKVLAKMQDRYGPTRTGPAGLLQPLADGIKLLAKEDIVPANADRYVFLFAPLITFVTAFVAFAVIPFGFETIPIPFTNGEHLSLFISDVNIGVLFILAMSGLGVYGVVLGGYASGNRYSLLGGLRSAAQVISYEVILGLALLGPFLISGTLSLRGITQWQQHNLWFVVVQAPAFIIYLIAAVAETNRAPFDLPEAESELTGGYFTEYSGFRFSLYFLGEYVNMLVVSAIAATVFLGGAAGPILPGPIWLALKVACFIFLYFWLRATLPRFRYDQLMGLAWKLLLPLVLLSIVVTAIGHLYALGQL
ncbi:MAG TPA: NADH-quinone oxidoreductase subunit NuoH [Thermomicrobiales bacterium]|nr:NADH-quinone oxidoreductase subunit NuoH [Thermomicrobiales bacterium]